jgi:hypothetical protein
MWLLSAATSAARPDPTGVQRCGATSTHVVACAATGPRCFSPPPCSVADPSHTRTARESAHASLHSKRDPAETSRPPLLPRLSSYPHRLSPACHTHMKCAMQHVSDACRPCPICLTGAATSTIRMAATRCRPFALPLLPSPTADCVSPSPLTRARGTISSVVRDTSPTSSGQVIRPMNTSSEWSSGEGYHLVGGARHFSDGTHKVRVVHAAYTAHIHALLFSPLPSRILLFVLLFGYIPPRLALTQPRVSTCIPSRALSHTGEAGHRRGRHIALGLCARADGHAPGAEQRPVDGGAHFQRIALLIPHIELDRVRARGMCTYVVRTTLITDVRSLDGQHHKMDRTHESSFGPHTRTPNRHTQHTHPHAHAPEEHVWDNVLVRTAAL